MFLYHTFKDLGIEGIYDHEPLLKHYGFPDDEYWVGKKILDAGCASGFFSKYFAERGGDVTSIDINVDVINKIKQETGLKNINIVNADIYDTNYKNQFDFVFCGSLLMHAIYPMNLLNVIYKSLKPDGDFILCTGGIHNNESVMFVEPYLGRGKGVVENEIKTANESLWWLSPKAGINMLKTIGFKNIQCVDSFVLTSTPYGVSIGHNFSSLHHVWKSKK
jgi:2-polyprenyl-3-methyl-5-hydroxy-6-metoxy-1,4-benzoquinol methylase